MVVPVRCGVRAIAARVSSPRARLGNKSAPVDDIAAGRYGTTVGGQGGNVIDDPNTEARRKQSRGGKDLICLH